MELSIDKLKRLRTDRGWSQEHLALVSGLSYRTIQRIEEKGRCSLESLMSLSMVFSLTPSELIKNRDNSSDMASFFDLIFTFSGEGRYESAIVNSPELLLKPQPDFVGKLTSDILPKDISDSTLDAIQRLKSGERMVEYDYQLDGSKGTVFFKSLMTQVNNDAFLAVVSDQTKQILASEKIQKSESLLNEVGELMKIGGWDIDLKTWEINWTKHVKDIYEVDYVLTIEEGILFYAPEARPIIEKAFQDLIQMGIPYDMELPFITAKGKNLHVRIMGIPHFDNGEVSRASGIIQDITHTKIEDE